MADESNAPTVTDVTKAVEESTLSVKPVAAPAVAEAKPAEGGVIATEGVAEGKCYRAQICRRGSNATVA
jgi:hypothetical protein